MGRRDITPDHERIFLEALSEWGNISDAALASGISRKAWYHRKAKNKVFAKKWEQARALGGAALEDECRRRAGKGYLEPVFYKGQKCGVVRKYSDTLLIVMLKSIYPERFADRSKVTHDFKEELVSKLNKALAKSKED